MVEAELLIGHLRKQVRNLQSLLSYLENRDTVQHEDYAYSRIKLRELIGGLKELEGFSSQRSGIHRLRVERLN